MGSHRVKSIHLCSAQAFSNQPFIVLLKNNMDICKLVRAIGNQVITIENIVQLDIRLTKWTWLNLRKPQMLFSEEVGQYLSGSVECYQKIGHRHNGCNRPFLMSRLRRSIDDLNPRWPTIHLDVVVVWRQEWHRIKGKSGH